MTITDLEKEFVETAMAGLPPELLPMNESLPKVIGIAFRTGAQAAIASESKFFRRMNANFEADAKARPQETLQENLMSAMQVLFEAIADGKPAIEIADGAAGVANGARRLANLYLANADN